MLGISASRREGGLGPPSRVATAAGNLVASRSVGGRSPPHLASAEQWGTFRPEAEASNQAGMHLGCGPPSTAAVAGEQGERRRKREKEIEWDQDPFWPAERAREGRREGGNAGESGSEQARVRQADRQTDRQAYRTTDREVGGARNFCMSCDRSRDRSNLAESDQQCSLVTF